MARRVLRHALARAALAAGVGLTGMSAQAAEQLNQLSTQLQLLAMALDELTTVTDPAVQAQLAATADAVIAKAKRVG